MDNWTEDEWYEQFLDIMFTEWTADEMGYMHHSVSQDEDGHS